MNQKEILNNFERQYKEIHQKQHSVEKVMDKNTIKRVR